MPLYSHSKISTFEQCAFKFKLRYIDKVIPEIEKTIEAHLGKSVHEALEWLYNIMKEAKRTPSLDETIIQYTEAWQKEFSNELTIVKKELTHKDYFNKGVQFIIGYYTQHYPFKEKTIECEKKIIISLDEEGKYKIQGFIDRLAQNLETGEIEIHDYKTANSLPTKEKIENDRQLALYSIAIKEEFGNKAVCLIWHYLAHDTKICSRRTDEQLSKLKKETLEIIKKIESTSFFPTNKGILCNWCEYKNLCPEFNSLSDFKKEVQTTLEQLNKIKEKDKTEIIEEIEKYV